MKGIPCLLNDPKNLIKKNFKLTTFQGPLTYPYVLVATAKKGAKMGDGFMKGVGAAQYTFKNSEDDKRPIEYIYLTTLDNICFCSFITSFM